MQIYGDGLKGYLTSSQPQLKPIRRFVMPNRLLRAPKSFSLLHNLSRLVYMLHIVSNFRHTWFVGVMSIPCPVTDELCT